MTKSRCSKDIITVPAVVNGTLLHQSFVLNCLSGNIKAKPDLFVKSARYESNFFESGNAGLDINGSPTVRDNQIFSPDK